MKILFVAAEFPYPPNHGGRVDTWNRIVALHDMGNEIYLVTWDEIIKGDTVTAYQMENVKKYVKLLDVFHIQRGIKRILSLLKYPSLVAGRLLKQAAYQRLLKHVKTFSPNFVFIDGLYAGDIGSRMAKDMNIPYGLRLHNIEHIYMYGQFKLAGSYRKKLSAGLAVLHLKPYEYRVIQDAKVCFDISVTGLNFWRNEGFNNCLWLPPVYVKEPVTNNADVQTKVAEYDVAFLGNLNAPNNVMGIKWFVKEVLPLIRQEKSDIKVLLMGSRPVDDIKELCIQARITLLPDPEAPEQYLAVSKVLINPVKFGSGVNIKAIDMLFTDKYVVTTSAGIAGLPEEVCNSFYVANTPGEFAEGVIGYITAPKKTDINEQREPYRAMFRKQAISVVTNMMAAGLKA